MGRFERLEVPAFDRSFFRSPEPVTRIGDGELGGKARGLVQIRDVLASAGLDERFPGVAVYVPKMAVIATGIFDAFIARNGLSAADLDGLPDERVGRAFMQAELPVEIVGDLRAIVEEVRTPLAVRSSSLLEDAMFQPFAGVYETKMVPNNQPDADARFLRLVEAVKFVYASTWFRAARRYLAAAGKTCADERMAVIVQEVVGERHNDRYYPHLSGVGRSYNFFPGRGVDPRDGVVNLALGLGKTIVDGGVSWIYSPARPKAPPPFGSVREMLGSTQTRFWAVNMGKPPAYDPVVETEYLVEEDLGAADYDGTLAPMASTYDAGRDRVVPGTGVEGPRILNFPELLSGRGLPFNGVVRELLTLGERALEGAVEIELAMVLPGRSGGAARLGFLQMRPMLVAGDEVEIAESELSGSGLLLSSSRVMGNGSLGTIRDVVYVRPDRFDRSRTRAIASELESLNRPLVEKSVPYVLIGFGRWGSSDPWLGIPVDWGQIGGARVIVESTIAGMDVEASQGAHFFHNIIGFRVLYLCVHHDPDQTGAGGGIHWSVLERAEEIAGTEHVRHVRLASPLRVKVDGRSGRGAIWHS